MNKVRTSGCALVLFGALVFSASAAAAQACTPVVIAFRHAEDTNPGSPPPIFTLTPTGMRHRDLYPEMVPGFTKDKVNNFCDVTKVYAASKVKKKPCSSNCDSATNAFDTGSKLANSVMSEADPITKVGSGPIDAQDPKTQLWEYLGNGQEKVPTQPIDYNTPVAKALRDELLATANRGESSAIFWTSQGLHVLGGVITGQTSKVPDKNAASGAVTPPRNAVYVFTAIVTANSVTGFNDIVKPSSYVQCFNHIEYADSVSPKAPQFIAPTGSPPTQDYYCGSGGDQINLGGTPNKVCDVGARCGSSIPNDNDPSASQTNKDVFGKICGKFMSPKIKAWDIFGSCQ